MARIEIRGARIHNLRNMDVDVPKHRLVCFTGVSGSGKSSLVFDTICTEAQRQLVETFSTYARRRLPKLSRPPVDQIRGISPCIVIDQKRLGRSSRSTVGTVTEIYTYLRMMYSRCGAPFIGWSHRYSFNHPDGMCPSCKGLGKRITVDIDKLLDRRRSIEEGAILHPDYDVGKWYWRELVYTGVLPADKPLQRFTEAEMDRLLWADGVPIEYDYRGEKYKRKFDGVARKLEQLHVEKDEDQLSAPRREAYKRLFTAGLCRDCGGARLNSEALSVKLASGWTIDQLVEMELTDLDQVLKELVEGDHYQPIKEVVATLGTKMRRALGHLIDIGVGYLSLNRSVPTLSGGESQRVKMARQLDCDLVDLVYILDEPSVGLHPRDIDQLIEMLRQLRDKGNSVLVVEHDTAVMRAADWIIDIGPCAGKGGGTLMFSGHVNDLVRTGTETANALRRTAAEATRRRSFETTFQVAGANTNNLRNVSAAVPLGVLTCFTGVAGSGKSSLAAEFIAALRRPGQPGAVVIDQRPVGRSSRSNPATYAGIFDSIRRTFAVANGVSPSMFSFNAKGACPECKGRGSIDIDLSFLDDVRVACRACKGKRYREEILALTYNNRSIHDVLEMTVSDAMDFFASTDDHGGRRQAKIIRGLQLFLDVGVGYLRLGQSLPTLSRGEAQRIKLASEMTKSGNVYVMDEPTTGLHPTDIDRLIAIIDRLIAAGNSVVVIEHNLDVIAAADWIVDLGPEGGGNGGTIIAEGTPETVAAQHRISHTGRYLKDWLGL